MLGVSSLGGASSCCIVLEINANKRRIARGKEEAVTMVLIQKRPGREQ